jgi:hypothetical protein
LSERPPAKEIEQDQVTAAELRYEPIVQMMIVREPVHQNDGRFFTLIFANVELMGTTLNPSFAKALDATVRFA